MRAGAFHERRRQAERGDRAGVEPPRNRRAGRSSLRPQRPPPFRNAGNRHRAFFSIRFHNQRRDREGMPRGLAGTENPRAILNVVRRSTGCKTPNFASRAAAFPAGRLEARKRGRNRGEQQRRKGLQ